MGEMRSWRTIRDEGAPESEPDKREADDYIARIVNDARQLNELVARDGLVLGGMSNETALEQLKRAERRLAEIRDTLQKRVGEKGGR